MNLNQLEYFVKVAECLNFTKAASQCYISQTAMTQQIKALEKTVGVPLFIRSKHHVELTAAGKVYLKEARIILDRSEEALRITRLVSEGVEGELNIGYISGYGQSDFVELLRNFREAYPKVKINLFRSNYSILVDRLNKRDSDIIFAISTNRKENDGLKHMYLKSYPVMAVLNEGHHLSDRDMVTYRDLKDEAFIMMQPENRSLEQLEESVLIYERGGFLPNVIAMEREPETLLLMVSVGLGISIMPEYIVRPYLKNRDFHIVPLVKEDGSAETVDLEVSWNEDTINPAVEQFINVIK